MSDPFKQKVYDAFIKRKNMFFNSEHYLKQLLHYYVNLFGEFKENINHKWIFEKFYNEYKKICRENNVEELSYQDLLALEYFPKYEDMEFEDEERWYRNLILKIGRKVDMVEEEDYCMFDNYPLPDEDELAQLVSMFLDDLE